MQSGFVKLAGLKRVRLTVAGVIALSVVSSFPQTSVAAGTTLHIGSIDFDKNQQVKLTYSAGGTSETTLGDDGPILICAVFRLLQKKYYDAEPRPSEVSRDDLALIQRSAAFLPIVEKDSLTEAVKKYSTDKSEENRNKLFDALVVSIGDGLLEHKTQFETVTVSKPREYFDWSERAEKLKERIDVVLNKRREADIPDDEMKVIGRLRQEIRDLNDKIQNVKPARKVSQGNESPARWRLCASEMLSWNSARSRTSITNTNVEELLGSLRTVLDRLDRQGARGPRPLNSHSSN